MDRFFARKCSVLLILLSALLMPIRMYGLGWTPTDGGLVVDLKQGDRFLLSVVVGDKEYFVTNYNRYTGGDFDYSAGSYLKLMPQAGDATEPSDMTIWSAGAPLTRVDVNNIAKLGKNNDYFLNGIVYTIWNDGKTLKTQNNHYKFLGDLTSNYEDVDACDVVFVVPTDYDGITSFDPNKTLRSIYGRTDQNATTGKINGKIGKGWNGMTYREVYMLEIPRFNPEVSYTNAALVTFNTTNTQKSWSNGDIKCDPGHAAYAYADDKHKATHRTLFRLYMLDKPLPYCDSYYFATDEQDYKKYRRGPGGKESLKWSDSTALKKTFTWDHFTPMTAVDKSSSKFYTTDYMNVPVPDSTYYYVGYNNDYRFALETMGSNGAHSEFVKIRELPLATMPGFKAPAGAYGQMVVDTTSSADNLGVKFEPAGYFLKIEETGKNIRLHKTAGDTWTCEERWTISGDWAKLHIRTMLMTGPEFREDDSGAAVEGWSKWVQGEKVPVSDGMSIVDKSGYAQITINNTDSNGHMVFILTENTKWIRYNNNGFMGMEMPLQYPAKDGNTVTIMAPRIKSEYTFLGWDTQADGNGTRYQEGDKFTFSEDGEVMLYAQAEYRGSLQMAISFINPADSKRYFLTHPNSSAPRYARARHFEHWENTWQGMEDAENADPNYLSTFEAFQPESSKIKAWGAGIAEKDKHLTAKEYVLDPRRYTMKGYTDSLMFYEFFAPPYDEFLGLYYADPNTILANNSWSGLFTTTSTATSSGWPDYKVPYIESTKLKSERYLEEEDRTNHPDSLTLKIRSNSDKPFVKYNAAEDKFDGVATAGEATDFQISAVIVADEHYVVFPDTMYAWNDTIEFGYHKGEQISEEVWSALNGKQLMAVMIVDGDTVYFHPNRKKIISDPNNLYLSPDFRVTQIFEYIRDSRVKTAISEGDSVQHQTTDHYWHHNIVSGLNSPIGVKDAGGNDIDIVDTFRIHLTHDGISKIKEYRGRWKKGASGLKVDNKNGSARHRDIIVRTKSFHYSPTQTRTALRAEKESYSFGPLAGQNQEIKLFLIRESYRDLLDKDGNKEGEEILSADTLKEGWNLVKSGCNLRRGDAYFTVNSAVGDIVTISVKGENTEGINKDTLIINSIQIGSRDTTLTPVRVPLVQAALEGDELIWSAVCGGQRYYLMAGSGGLIARKYKEQDNTLYKENTTTHLIKGMADDVNADKQYITPWKYEYHPIADKQTDTLTLYTQLSGDTRKYFCITGEGTSARGNAGAAPSLLIYRYANVFTNDNANFEEQVRLRYTDKWLRLTGVSDNVPTIELIEDSASATIFSWTYLHDEYSLLNNGDYPSAESVEFGYNRTDPASVQTLYKAQHEYSMLVDNKMKYLCLREETDISVLTSADGEWKTQCDIDTIRDHRVSTLSALDTTRNRTTLTTTIIPRGSSPMGVTYGGKYVNIVDTLRVRLSLQDGAPTYHFKGDWSTFTNISDATVKIPLIRRTYHEEDYNALICYAESDEAIYTFPSTLVTSGPRKNDEHTFTLRTNNRKGKQIVNVYGEVAAVRSTEVVDLTSQMRLTEKTLAEIRLADEYGNTPVWCELSDTTDNTVTVKCTDNGIRSPRTAYLYFAYIVTVGGQTKFVNYRITISQPSLFIYANNQHLIHTIGASGDPLRADGMQQVHENKRILYYYPDQDVELPVRERAFYGWWRWYREGAGEIGDSDIPDSVWRIPPKNDGKYKYPFRIIGDSVWTDDTKTKKKLVTMGRYTVFHYPSKDYGNKNDPPSKSARVAPPVTTYGAAHKDTVTYAVDLSNYYDNLPMSLKDKNNVDVALMDTMTRIVEPTLSIREVFELHPWTEMAAKLEEFKHEDKSDDGRGSYTKAYMEDHVVMAPIGNRLLLRTEQRYDSTNLRTHGHSESLLGYYMRDDKWGDWSDSPVRQDTMIWCGGWDADCKWYTYNTISKVYSECTHNITSEEDFLEVPARTSISTGHQFDTIYYFLRARSWKTLTAGTEANPDTVPVAGDNWFNICRYMVIYHNTNLYGPKQEVTTKGVAKALITNDSIEQNYEVLERLNFDYNKPGSSYTVYPHPLPWADASYGYTYPETSDLPHNRYHSQSDFPNHGEYGLINRIPEKSYWASNESYWRPMQQHGGAANGYMIYCDGMASAGQVAALTLNTQLCEGQKMYFSGYVGNPSSQTGKSDPNFIFTVQGSTDGSTWEDISSYMTGDIKPSNNWYQIFFPIQHNKKTTYKHFRVRIFNVASNFDGNDFVIDDMCIFATKPPLISYQAETECVDGVVNDSITQVVLRLDYQGFTDKSYNNTNVYYTVVQCKTGSTDTTFVKMEDGYLNQEIKEGETTPVVTPDTIFGHIAVPAADFNPRRGIDSIYTRLNDLVDHFKADNSLKQGYIYENLDGVSRPVLYVVHQAKMAANIKYQVHMALTEYDMMRSICAMTSELKVTDRMMLELNGEEQENREENVCPNSTYDIGLRVKGTQYVEGSAPIDLSGSCFNDWLLYGDTAEVSSKTRYGYYYSDIVKVVKEILRANDASNTNRYVQNFSDVNRNVLVRMQGDIRLSTGVDAYALLDSLVSKGFLTLYKEKITATVMSGDSLEYVVFPILGTASQAMLDAGIDVCPQPLYIKLKPSGTVDAPLLIGGINRDSTQLSKPMVILASEKNANKQITLHLDSIATNRAIYSVNLLSTDDPNFVEGLHSLSLMPDKVFGVSSSYYKNGDDVILTPSGTSVYHMRPGYNYTFAVTMQTVLGETTLPGGCPVGTIPFTVSVVPDYLRWDPKSNENNQWNNPSNWVGVNDANEKIHDNAHFAPLSSSNVIIPTLDAGLPYPVLPDLDATTTYDSIKQIGFEYNKCNVIRFMPGAAMGQQQRMDYSKAVVDMSTPKEKWALRSAPITGMLSGDIYMANDDLDEVTSPWEVGYFDANGRNTTTGNASFWLSVYNRATTDKGNGHDVKDSARTAVAEWSRVTNGLTLYLPPASGWGIFTRTKSNKDAAIRLPKKDDVYYYYNQSGDKMHDIYEYNLLYRRDTCAREIGGSGNAGKLAFYPDGTSQNYTINNGVADTMFVFGNPTMGYIDIWGFIADNPGLANKFDYINSEGTGSYVTVTKATADLTTDTITEQKRYLPPMHAIVLKAASATSKEVTLKTSRVITSASQKSPAPAPRRVSASGRSKGIMKVTAINPASSVCTSRLLIGQGYHNAVRDGEDAILTTINVGNFSSLTPSTPFNIYASEGEYGLCIDLRDEVENIPVSFYMSELPYEPMTQLWFTGVNNIDGELVFYDALTGSERTIIDGICIKIPTPEQSHETRYYIRRRGFNPNDPGTSIATDIDESSHFEMDGATAVKIIKDGHVLILRDGHVYTMFGQKLR